MTGEQGGEKRPRPGRAELERAALDLLARHGARILRTARRFSISVEDAEDAYQRSVEILLTKAPNARLDELLPWLLTVVRHEALAIRRQRERAAPASDDPELTDRLRPESAPDEVAERYDQLRLGAEAMRRLKPQEIRCLLLRAEGYSYEQICEETGFSYTKVNRCLTEGRRAFLDRVAGIEAGTECERLAPLLSALVDGEATAADLAALRPHLRGCLTCRARIREFRDAPRRIAALLPPVAVDATDPSGFLGRAVETVTASLNDRVAAFAQRWQDVAEVASAQKVAAVAASTAAVAGGGLVALESLEPSTPPQLEERRSHRRAATPAKGRGGADGRAELTPLPTLRVAAANATAVRPRVASRRRSSDTSATDERRRSSDAEPTPAQSEFAPGAEPSSGSSQPASRSTARSASSPSVASGGSSASQSGGGAEEFAP